MKKFYSILSLIAGLVIGSVYITHAAPVTPSAGVGTNPVNGYYLQTNGVTSTWAATIPATVSLTGSSTANTFPYWIDANGNLSSSSPISYATSTGHIGIGTTTPANALVVNDSGNATLQINSNNNGVPTLFFSGTAGSILGTLEFLDVNHKIDFGNNTVYTTWNTYQFKQNNQNNSNVIPLAIGTNALSGKQLPAIFIDYTTVPATTTGISALNVSGTAYVSGNVGISLIAVPAVPTLSTSTGGSLASSTYFVKLTAVDGAGIETPSSTQASIANTTTTNKVNVSWNPVAGAAFYKIYIATTTNAESLYASTTITSYTFSTTTISNGTVNPTATSTPPTTNATVMTSISPTNYFGGTTTLWGTLAAGNANFTSPKLTTGNAPTVNISGSNPSLNLTNLNDGASAGTWQVTYNGQQFTYAGQNNGLYVGQAFNGGNDFVGTTGNNGIAVTGPTSLSTIQDDGNGHSGYATSSVAATNGTVSGSDAGGLITITTSTTTSTLTFAHAWLIANPVCQAGIASGTPNYFSMKANTSTAVITANATLATNTIVSYICQGNPI